MDAQKRIDKIAAAVQDRVQEEVGGLLGTEFLLSSPQHQLIGKEQFFDKLAGKQIFASIDLSGAIEGVGGLFVTVSDAVRLGGTLIMLPPAELEEVARSGDYTAELADSYGEIANIIAGSFTKVFEEMYPKKFRFIRKEHDILQPTKVDIGSEEPLPDQPYYQVSFTMGLGDMDMGSLSMLMPAEPFGLAVVDEKSKPADAAGVPEGGGTGEKPEKTEERKPVDIKKQKKRLDKIFDGCQEKFGEEVTALSGSQVKFSGMESRLISKEDFFFDEVDGKQIMAEIEIAGDRPGTGYLFFGLKGAIHVGGVLIMLPPSELENYIAEEDFSADLQDSYGEIANIITGACSLAFEEQYPDSLRVIRKEIQQVAPMKVEVGSEEPVPDIQYYLVSMAAAADGSDLGRLRFLFPASVLQLEAEAPAVDTVSEPPEQQVAAEQQEVPAPEEVKQHQAAPVPKIDPGFNLANHQKKVDKLLNECREKVQNEVSELLGTDFGLGGLDNRLVSKEDFFFDEANGKQVVANMDVVGEAEGRSYLFISLKDAIHTGGVLIMLPASELEKTIVEEEFNEDTNDAYGEIANIIAGVYTAVFEEQYTKSLRFIKTDLALVVPMKVETDSEEPVPNEMYYMSQMSLSVGGEQKGKVHMLFPAELLQLDMLGREEELAAIQAAQAAEAGGGQGAAETSQQSAGGAVQSAVSYEPADILVINNDDSVAAMLTESARQRGVTVRVITFQDDIRSALTAEVKTVYLVMREVSEQAFGIAINVRAACSLPLVAAGPGWTRSKVIKAVKYGVSDILLTPAGSDDVMESIEKNLVRMAA